MGSRFPDAARIASRMKRHIQPGWVVDPKTRVGWNCSVGNWVREERLEVANSPIYLSLPELFAKIDEDNAD